MRKKLLAITLSLAMLISAIAATGVPSVSAENAIFTVAEDFEDINVTGTEGAYNAIGCTYPYGKALYFGRGSTAANATITFDKAGTADDAALAFWFDTNGSGFSGAANMSFVPMTAEGVEMCMGTAYTYYTVIDGVVAEAHPTSNFTIALPAKSSGWVIMPLPAEGTWHKGGTGTYYGTCQAMAGVYLEYVYYNNASLIVDQFSFVKDVDAFKALVADDEEQIPGYVGGHNWKGEFCLSCGNALINTVEKFDDASAAAVGNGSTTHSATSVADISGYGNALKWNRGTDGLASVVVSFSGGSATDEGLAFYVDTTAQLAASCNYTFHFNYVNGNAGFYLVQGAPYQFVSLDGTVTERTFSTSAYTMPLEKGLQGWVVIPMTSIKNASADKLSNFFLQTGTNYGSILYIDEISFVADTDAAVSLLAAQNKINGKYDVDELGTSINEAQTALRFGFQLNAEGVTADGYVRNIENATVTIDGYAYTLVDFGAIISNKEDATLTMEGVDNRFTKKIAAVKVFDYTDSTVSFACGIKNIPNKGAVLYARSYMVISDGSQNIVVYGEAIQQSINGYLNG